MPNLLLPHGIPVTLVTNQVYALPIAKTTLFCGDTTPALEQSNLADFSTKTAIALVGGMSSIAAVFLRTTAGTPTIILNRD